jgi:hypothetical protein
MFGTGLYALPAGRCAVVLEGDRRTIALTPDLRIIVPAALTIEAPMPIRRELRSLYPAHWSEISRRVRFERAHGVCQGCGRPHGATVRCLPDGRWYDSARQTWRDRRGRTTRWPDLEQMVRLRTTRVVLAAAHLDHDPTNNRLRNLRSLCQRCHMLHDRPHHLVLPPM